MKNIKIIMILAVLTTAWGCSDDDKSGQNEPQWTGSTFALSAKPEWKIDWTSDATQPDWQEPSVMKYECYMNMLVTECDFWDFISYNPYVSRSKQLKVLRIKRNEEEIKLLEERLSLAVDYIREQMNKIDNIQTIIK